MHYLIVLVVPLMMLADYYLTLFGARLNRHSGYGQVFATEGYELNPFLQQDVARQRRFSPRHLAGVVVMTAALVLLAWLTEEEELDSLFQGLLGLVFTVNLILLGRHAMNILQFRYLMRHPDQLVGEVHMSRALVLRLSQYQLFQVLFPLLVIALVTQAPFALGSALGACVLMAAHVVWEKRAGTPARQPGPAAASPQRDKA